MPGYFLPSVVLKDAAELVTELGGDALAIAAELGIAAGALQDPDIPVPARAVGAYFEQAAQRCGCRGFGVKLAGRSGMAMLGPLWVLLRNAGSVRQMFEDLAAHYDIFTSAAAISLEVTEGGVFVGWDTTMARSQRSVQVVEFTLALLAHEVRQHAGEGWHPPAVLFRHTRPRDLADHRRMLGPQLQFDQDRNALFMDTATLALPMNRRGLRARSLMKSWLRQETGAAKGMAGRVEAIVRALLPFAPCTLEEVSRALGIAPRTLQEHLGDAGSSFKRIKDAVRADLALKYLRQSSLSLSEISEILGYAELSNFSRSFRRWHGQPASAVRRELRA